MFSRFKITRLFFSVNWLIQIKIVLKKNSKTVQQNNDLKNKIIFVLLKERRCTSRTQNHRFKFLIEIRLIRIHSKNKIKPNTKIKEFCIHYLMKTMLMIIEWQKKFIYICVSSMNTHSNSEERNIYAFDFKQRCDKTDFLYKTHRLKIKQF